MKNALLVIQVGTFVGLGVLLVRAGSWKLGVAQLLLAAVQAIVYS